MQVQRVHGIIIETVIVDVVYIDGARVASELDGCEVVGSRTGVLRPAIGV